MLFKILVFLLTISQLNANRFLKPEDLFPQNPAYRPTPSQSDYKKAPNPFTDTYRRNDPDDLFLGRVLFFNRISNLFTKIKHNFLHFKAFFQCGLQF